MCYNEIVESTSHIESPSQPQRLTYKQLAIAWERSIKEDKDIEVDDPTYGPITYREKLDALGDSNEDVAKFTNDVMIHVQGEHNKLLFARFASVLFSESRNALDPNRKIEMNEEERVTK